jgi:hypothetical protein
LRISNSRRERYSGHSTTSPRTMQHEKLACRRAPRPMIAGRVFRREACPAYRQGQLHVRIVRALDDGTDRLAAAGERVNEIV